MERMAIVANKISEIVGREKPELKDAATLLDNIEDCMVCHYCHNLSDTPDELFPLFDEIDELETESRLYPFDYFKSKNEDEYNRFVQNYFGYYFSVLSDRMKGRILNGGGKEPILYLQVTSDGILSPMLKILEADEKMVKKRPVWLSQIVFQLLMKEEEEKCKYFKAGCDEVEDKYYVRVVFNGEDVRTYEWKEWKSFVSRITPTQNDCSLFFDNYPLLY